MDKFETLKKFKELLDEGIITQEEFDKKKEELLGAIDSKETASPTASVKEPKKESTLDILEKLNGKSKNNFSGSNVSSQVSETLKKIPKKAIIIVVAVILAIVVICSFSGGVGKDEKTLKSCLLNPSSLIVYQAYTNDNYSDGGHATLFYFGAENKGGGISDDWALVYKGDVQFYSDFEAAEDSGDNDGVLDNSDVIYAKFAVASGSEDWKEVNP